MKLYLLLGAIGIGVIGCYLRKQLAKDDGDGAVSAAWMREQSYDRKGY